MSSITQIRRTADANPILAGGLVLILGNLLLVTSAKVQVPFWPVPMTLQTYVVLAMGMLLGWRLGAATVAAYLLEGAAGWPVFAGTPAKGIGLGYMAGPTGGYLVGYLVAVIVVGFLAAKRPGRSMLGTAAILLVGEAAIIGFGCLWLAVQFGWSRALTLGLGPFLVGDALKLALAAITVTYYDRLSANRG